MDFRIEFSGHPNVRCNHEGTIEITREPHLTPQGDCIAGVSAGSGCAGLPPGLKARLRDPAAEVTVSIRVNGEEFVVVGRGHRDLALTHKDDIVVRKSGFVCPRTLAVGCDLASDSIPRSMVRALRDPRTRGTFTVSVG